eukprot:TRINITY_DN27159_c0_g1_i1.p1 TRINITY_DN27159_c0_g1~~TRINITY_DN27159_c0_g1_i1.p1  ORF type:complete len:284 (-),score=67.73 TRINITY_DN27159_c0_g1_i1:562-1413(-)
MPASMPTEWTKEQDKAFETALAKYWDESKDKWRKIAEEVPGKSPTDVKLHYDALVDDVQSIDGGVVPAPVYSDENLGGVDSADAGNGILKGNGQFSGSGYSALPSNSGGGGVGGKGSSKAEQERRKGVPWTEQEHKLFLLGLEKFGKGDWRSISRNFVITRTPTQVASHAQKYFIRLNSTNSVNRDRRRSSIHDITSVNSTDASPQQTPITGQGTQSADAASQPPIHSSQAGLQSVSMYGPTVGQPMTGPIGSAVGTPVMLPPGHAPPYMPVAYPMPQPNMHR